MLWCSPLTRGKASEGGSSVTSSAKGGDMKWFARSKGSKTVPLRTLMLDPEVQVEGHISVETGSSIGSSVTVRSGLIAPGSQQSGFNLTSKESKWWCVFSRGLPLLMNGIAQEITSHVFLRFSRPRCTMSAAMNSWLGSVKLVLQRRFEIWGL